MELTKRDIDLLIFSIDECKEKIRADAIARSFLEVMGSVPKDIKGMTPEEMKEYATHIVQRQKNKVDQNTQNQIDELIVVQAKLVLLKSSEQMHNYDSSKH